MGGEESGKGRGPTEWEGPDARILPEAGEGTDKNEAGRGRGGVTGDTGEGPGEEPGKVAGN